MNIARLIFALIGVLCIGACELTQPDSDDWRDLVGAIDALPVSVTDQAKIWGSNRKTAEYLENKDQDEPVFRGTCETKRGDVTIVLAVKDVLGCLNRSFQKMFDDCASGQFFQRMEGIFSNPDDVYGCTYEAYPGYGPEDRPEFFDVPLESDDAEDIARWLLQSDTIPDWLRPYVVAGGAGAAIGVAVKLLPHLCALSVGDHWSCPDNPNYPGVPQQGGTGGGGDR